MNVTVSGISGCQIRRHGRGPHAVGGDQTPRLSGGDFPDAAFYIDKEQAHAQGVWVGCGKNVGSIISIEIAFNVTGDVVSSVLAAHLQVPARILARSAVFGKVPCSRITEGNGAKIRADHVAGIFCAEDVLEIHKSAGSE